MKQYKCVNCGEAAKALYKTYGPSVLKLTKCEKCNGVVDKYIEYDPVIVMIDLVLLSREAQRHVLYNTEFKSYWKLFIILTMLETYGVWRSDSLFNIAINTMCGINSNSTMNITHLNIPVSIPIPESWRNNCGAWVHEERNDDSDLFIWEKDFYIQFLSTFTGIVVFISTTHFIMTVTKSFSLNNQVSPTLAMKGFSLANVSALGALPMLVWGADASARTRAAHAALHHAYAAAAAAATATVLFECPVPLALLAVAISNIAKYATYFHVTPYLREFIS